MHLYCKLLYNFEKAYQIKWYLKSSLLNQIDESNQVSKTKAECKYQKIKTLNTLTSIR